ncbi:MULTISPECIES: tRNA (uridine(34)/cytosine(34)/5-carboxymethylaminomethyluridine(34)-2'-O)-methyltransferase TrmL [unclassified Gemella]|uniref:tRNA (uridine(34)/cytosine(34)/5- carboxymethylaminomethyluridine(34)-2'-O)- methyltransferase TrmL n=1 Tax=unclassified Gemella TaxID=2624949 RepID=UPI001073CE27|nr:MULTISPECIES: tRNA (uridine(34)/cytosine(34)/5-carboxymethylaminomethyluridine(34)-2'-O)-methyltransferase TrmL [unclassified Gemella]MBF0710552.1 tRNA (uridine(34)/cytosine(34)/5-carboxymethylaminomethyluridine(34)-2'-O)-methyltransferase TrmL [Gemella sp. GL1.1]MBF0746279.1 tRNA (uridine(34)/cytosine(34)/5-carboxymethylaminomethyluridine(34)-2'-O)-methyltransferase TrmL [Gemella sp. 19428wG2_WT2a]NYS27896.1 tRNA (uridine(34)/cytosine(34)/5-carboxymethylaminomethyluridine(34)-2'-O)-methyltra
MNNIVLFQPEIPANTGNIARTCVGTNTRLHLIKPLGFSIDDKHVKRAGLDYWDNLDLVVWESMDDFLENTKDKNYFLVTKFGKQNYTDFDFSNQDNEDIYLIFGKETKGLPEEFREKYKEQTLRIPMTDKVRSLNLSNTAAMIIYEVLRQQNFKNLI